MSFDQLSHARKELTERYEKKAAGYMTTKKHRLAYIAARMPATLQANLHVLSKIKGPIKSLLDLGSGPGTTMHAAVELFPEIEEILLIEKDRELIEMGRAMAPKEAVWKCADLEKELSFPPHDLVVLSYSAGEIDIKKVLIRAFEATRSFLVIIEPGTTAHFERIRWMRTSLIELGAHLVAPCPHSHACPASWCHFSCRVERTSLHRRLKEGSLSYEDEKFAYLIVSKSPYPLPDARIVRHPQKRPGHVLLSLCTKEGKLEERIVSKKQKETYRIARKSSWGDCQENGAGV